MSFRHRYDALCKSYWPMLPDASTVFGMFSSSDIGRLVGQTTGGAGICAQMFTGATGDVQKVAGYVVSMPSGATASTAGSTSPIFVQPILRGEIIEAEYSTAVNRSGGANLMATSNIGRYFGLGGTTGGTNSTTVILGMYIDPSVASTAPGTTDGNFFKLLGFSTDEGKCWGVINSTHLLY